MNTYDVYRAARRGGMWHKTGSIRAGTSGAALRQVKKGKALGEVFKVKLTSKSNPARKAVRLKNFTGTIKKLANGTVSVVGRAKRSNPTNKQDSDGSPNLRAGRPSEKEFYRRALKYYGDHGQAEQALAMYRKSKKKR